MDFVTSRQKWTLIEFTGDGYICAGGIPLEKVSIMDRFYCEQCNQLYGIDAVASPEDIEVHGQEDRSGRKIVIFRGQEHYCPDCGEKLIDTKEIK